MIQITCGCYPMQRMLPIKPTEVIVGKHKVFVVQYFVGMLDAIKEYTGIHDPSILVHN